MKTLKETTQEWVETQGEWLGDPLHAPALSQLLLLAEGIDADPTKASLHSQYGLTYRSLLQERPKEEQGLDDLDLLLRNSVGEGVPMS